ncbi:hypothetical protein BN1110_05085 [bacterium YEK0313]|nr:hypothetical protein BN1110_05085 [bacterium YEK0313]
MTSRIETKVAISDEALEAVAGGGFKNAISFGAAGSQIGILGGGLFGPAGAVIGGAVGAVAGAVGGVFVKDDPKVGIHVMY